MPPINLGSKHQDLLKAYLEVSKGDKPDWATISSKADYPSAKYARDQFTRESCLPPAMAMRSTSPTVTLHSSKRPSRP